MQVLYERCAAVDVGKDVIAVAVRLPGDGPDGRQTVKRTFKTFYGVLAEAARWLVSEGVTHVAMEATGIYSMPACHALLEHGAFEKVLVCNAGHVKNVPGRNTDLADAEWLVQLLECGLLAGSFIPPADIKAARDVIRYCAKVVQSKTSEVQRLGNVLQDAGIKTDSVASSIVTKSGRSMIESLTDGERRPEVLAELAIGRMRPKIPDLAMALEGRFGEHHALMCRLHLDHIDHLVAMIAKLDAQIEAMMAPFRAARDLLTTIPASARWPPPRSSPRSAPMSGSTSLTPRTWPPGPGCARATTNPPANAIPAGAATATPTSSRSWSNPPGRRSATRDTSRPSTTGT